MPVFPLLASTWAAAVGATLLTTVTGTVDVAMAPLSSAVTVSVAV